MITKNNKLTVGRWFIELKQYGWRIVCLNWHWPRWKFGYVEDWYDGPHKAFIVGPLNIYWNF